MAKQFTWEAWDFDFEGEAYVIAKEQCPNKENVSDFICREDCLPLDCKLEMVVQEGWCKYQIRTDWADMDGEPHGWYVVEMQKNAPTDIHGKKKRGWFPVWIVRKGTWY